MHLALRLAAPLLLFAVPAAAQAPAAKAPPAPAAAAPAAPGPLSLKDYVALPANQAPVINAAKEQFQHLPGACAAVAIKPTGQLTIYQRLNIGVDGKPIAGVWSERLIASGCGQDRTLNVMTLNNPDGKPEIVALMPGDTRADPLTQKSALQYAQAIVAHSPIVANCREISFDDTHFDGFDGLPSAEVTDGRNNRPWHEAWHVAACGASYTIEMLFTPNAQGTQLRGSMPVKAS